MPEESADIDIRKWVGNIKKCTREYNEYAGTDELEDTHIISERS